MNSTSKENRNKWIEFLTKFLKLVVHFITGNKKQNANEQNH